LIETLTVGNASQGVACPILHLAQRGHQHRGLRILRKGLLHKGISFGYFLLLQEHFYQTCGQHGIVGLLLQLRLVQRGSTIVITVQEGVFRL
jgi:hypothetical protein